MRTKMLIAVLAVLAVFATTTTVLAQEGGGMRTQDISLGLNLSTSSAGYSSAGSKTSTVTTTTLILSPGYYVKPEHEVGGLVLIMGLKTDDSDASVTFIRPFYRYHFITVSPMVVPYAGVQLGSLGIKAGSSTLTGTSYGLSGGADYFLKENVAANLDLTYDAGKLTGAGADVTSTTTTISLGYKFFF